MNSDQRKHFKVHSSGAAISGISDPGRVRTENQDSILLDEDGGFMLLADGMGGHERGAEASRTALEVVQGYLQPEVLQEELCDITEGSGVPSEIVCLLSLVDSAVNDANRKIFERNRTLGLQRFMGTTLVGMVLVKGGFVLWFHVGDSRLYRFRGSRLECLTNDHSAYREWVRDGQNGARPAKNIITRAIGPGESVAADSMWEHREARDLYLLCSDGLTDMLTEEQIVEVLSSSEDVEEIAGRLIDSANEAGGKDNASVIVCRIL